MGSGTYKEEPATGHWKDKVTALHKELIEHIAESDDTLLNKYFEEGGLSEEEFRAGIHTAMQKQLFIPLFCTAAETNVGVARLMDFIAKYGSSPVDRATVTAHTPDGERNRGGAGTERAGAACIQNDGGGTFWGAFVFPDVLRNAKERVGPV